MKYTDLYMFFHMFFKGVFELGGEALHEIYWF